MKPPKQTKTKKKNQTQNQGEKTQVTRKSFLKEIRSDPETDTGDRLVKLDLRKVLPPSQHHSMEGGIWLLALSNSQALLLQADCRYQYQHASIIKLYRLCRRLSLELRTITPVQQGTLQLRTCFHLCRTWGFILSALDTSAEGWR